MEQGDHVAVDGNTVASVQNMNFKFAAKTDIGKKRKAKRQTAFPKEGAASNLFIIRFMNIRFLNNSRKAVELAVLR